MERLAEVAREGLRTDIPAFDPGDTIRVMVRVREGDKERLQAFEGMVIARRGGGISETFTVRKISAGVGVERLFPVHSPTIASIELIRRGRGDRRYVVHRGRVFSRLRLRRRDDRHSSRHLHHQPCGRIDTALQQSRRPGTGDPQGQS